jgi:hypothetical protein
LPGSTTDETPVSPRDHDTAAGCGILARGDSTAAALGSIAIAARITGATGVSG